MPKPLRVILCLIFLPLLFLSLLALNFVQLASLLALPFSGPVFRLVNRRAACFWFNRLSDLLEKVLRIEFVITGDPLPLKENAFVVANHQSMADIPALVVLASRCRRTADLKWFAKDVLKWVPGVGWGLLFLDCLFVKRNWNADKGKILATFERLRANRSAFWILSFVEGTRLTPAKLKRSQDFELSAGLPVLRNVMSPRTKGFTAALEGLGTLTEAVYDMTIAFEGFRVGEVPGLGALFFGPIQRVHMDARRFPIASLPADNPARAQWILSRFQEKDRRIASFRNTGELE
jgi:1-acyl-sn-glycerol-3-phosphate acyltransferase